MQLTALSLALTVPRAQTDIYRAIYGQTTPGARWHIDEAIRANTAAGVWGMASGWTAAQLSRCMIFQDSAGTLPVFAVEQPIGLVRDSRYSPGSGLGLPLTQSSTMARPAASARVNLLVATEDFTNGAWLKANSAVASSTNTVLLPIVNSLINQPVAVDAPIGRAAKFSIEVSGASGATVHIGLARFGSGAYEETILRVTLTDVLTRYTVSHSIVNSGQSGFIPFIRRNNSTADTATSVTAGKADLRLAVNATPALPPYQRVTTASDYDTSGFPFKAVFNGTNQWLTHAALDMTSTDEVTVWAALLKESDATTAAFYEFSTNLQSFAVFAPISASPSFAFRSKGSISTAADAVTTGFPAPNKASLIGRGDISADVANLSIAGTQVATNANDQGTGNYGNHPGFIGARAGTSLFFRGEIFELGVAGRVITAGELARLNARITQSAKI